MSDYSFDDSFSNIPRFIQPRVRIFLSVDLVGSSNLKQKGPDRIQNGRSSNVGDFPHDAWLPELSNFYGAFPKIFADEWIRGTSTLGDNFRQFVGYEPSLWKTNGDEIIYVKHIKDRSEITFFVSCWLKAIKRYKHESKTKLDVKSTCWCAGFPLNNSEIILDTSEGQKHSKFKEEWKLNNYHLLDNWYRKKNRNELLRDYIGPSIDIGFRLCELSTPKILPISVELAWLLANQDHGRYTKDQQENIEQHLNFPEIRFLGEISLKGVFGGHPYPVFYLEVDQNEKLRAAKDALDGKNNTESERGKIKEYCKQFFNTYEKHFPKPFIAQEDGGYQSQPFPIYIESVHQLFERFNQEKKRYSIDGPDTKKLDSKLEQTDPQESDLVAKTISNIINKPSLKT